MLLPQLGAKVKQWFLSRHILFAEGVMGEEYGLSTNAFAFVQGQVVEKLEQNILKSKNAQDALLENEEVAFGSVLGYLS